MDNIEKCTMRYSNRCITILELNGSRNFNRANELMVTIKCIWMLRKIDHVVWT